MVSTGSSAERRPLRVVAWSTGTVGRHAIAGIDRHPDLELVGVWVSDPAKNGRDAGELAGLGRDLQVSATTDRDALIALEPDAIVHTAMTDDRVFESIEDLVGFLEAGVNVVSSGPVLLQWPAGILPPEMLERIVKAGETGNASLHVNGIDPGFANDVLPLSLTSLSQRIDEVRVLEIADYSTYYQPVVMRDIFGFGQPLEDKPMLWEPGVLSMAWGSVVRQIAAGLGITLDEPLTENVDRRPAERDVETASVDIAAGTMGAVRFEVVGKVGGVPAGRARARHPDRRGPGAGVADAEGGRRLLPRGRHRRAGDGAGAGPPRRARRPQRVRDDRHRPTAGQRRAGSGRRRPAAWSPRSTCRW